MSDIKISELSGVTSLSPEDIFALSKSVGSTWTSKSIAASDLAKSLENGARVLRVAKDGIRDADTIEEAISLATALTPIETNPVVIKVFPGSYYEENPLTIPEWVSISSADGFYSAGVIANNDGVIFNASANSSLNGLTIIGLAAFTNIGYQSTVATTSEIKNCLFVNCKTGILSDAGSIAANFIAGLSYVAFDKFISCINAGFITATSCTIVKVLNSPTYGYHCYGANSKLYLFSCNSTGCLNAIYADDSAYIDALSCHMDDSENAIAIGLNGSSVLKVVGSIIEGSSDYDIQILSSTAQLSFSGHFDSYSRNIVSGATVNIVASDEGTGGAKFTGESSVEGAFGIGYPGAIFERKDIMFNVGSGRSYYKDQYGDTISEYWSYDSSAISGSKFAPYTLSNGYTGTQLIGDNDAIVIGSKYPFPAIRLDILTTSNVGSSTIVAEYWNGSTWIETTLCAYNKETMARLRDEPFTSTGDHYDEISQKVLESVGEVDGWESAYDVTDEIPAWTLGYPLYAIRFRNNGVLVTGMTFQRGKIRGSGFQSSTESGTNIRWGAFRNKRNQYIDSETFIADAVYPPSYKDVPMSSHISYSNIPNFETNTISQISSAFVIPADLDTASPLTCQFDGLAISSNTGTIATSVYIARIDSTSTSIIGGTLTDVEYTQLTNVAGAANSFTSVIQDVDVSNYGTDDMVLIGFRRKGTDPTDTYNGDFVVGDLTLKYYNKFG